MKIIVLGAGAWGTAMAISVNSVAPGWIATGSSTEEEQHAAELKEIGKRLKDFGVGGYLQHFVKKSARNYFDGCFGWGGLGETFYTEIFPERGTVLCS
mgnify:CR=1 FL=1